MSILSLSLGGLGRHNHDYASPATRFVSKLWQAFVAEQERRAEFYRLDDISPEQSKELKFLAAKKAGNLFRP